MDLDFLPHVAKVFIESWKGLYKNLNEICLLKQNNSFKDNIFNIHIRLIEPSKYIIINLY